MEKTMPRITDYDISANDLKGNAVTNAAPNPASNTFEAIDKVITDHSARIVTITSELCTLCDHLGSRTADSIVDAVAHDVNVKLTTLEVLQAKRRQLDTEYAMLLSAVTSLKEAIMKLREESYLDEERPKTTVALPARVSEFEIAPVPDDAFDAESLRREMEDAVNEGRTKKKSLFRSGK